MTDSYSVPSVSVTFTRNDTERLEKLFELYTKMTTSKTSKEGRRT